MQSVFFRRYQKLLFVIFENMNATPLDIVPPLCVNVSLLGRTTRNGKLTILCCSYLPLALPARIRQNDNILVSRFIRSFVSSVRGVRSRYRYPIRQNDSVTASHFV